MSDPMDKVVALLNKSDGRDLLLKLLQNTAALQVFRNVRAKKVGRADEWRGAQSALFEARTFFWLGRWIVRLHRLRDVLGVRTAAAAALRRNAALRLLVVLQLSFFSAFFLLDNVRLLLKMKVSPYLTAKVNADKLRSVGRKCRTLAYLAGLLGEVCRATTTGMVDRPTSLAHVTMSVCDLASTLMLTTPMASSWEPYACGLLSAAIGLSHIYDPPRTAAAVISSQPPPGVLVAITGNVTRVYS
eukprot:gene23193-35539_t